MIIQVLIDWCLTPTLAINTNQSINQSINQYIHVQFGFSHLYTMYFLRNFF
jgi:hypothetical protein